MALFVQKYGGTSVGDTEKIKKVASRIVKTKENGNDVVVVLSAMSGETERLLGLARQLNAFPPDREIDMLLSTGEQVSIALLAMAIEGMGHPVKSFTGHQVKILTDKIHTKARIMDIETSKIKKELVKGSVVIVAGFQGITSESEITTLGRGGSDTTAVAIAASLDACVCEIYTDVNGVYSANPSVVKNAKMIEKISYDEMLELAGLGAKVLQIRSVSFAKNYNVPIHVRSSFNDGEGTWVVEEEIGMEKVDVRGVACSQDEARLTVIGLPDKPGIAAHIFRIVSDSGIIVDMIVQNVGTDGRANISFTVPILESNNAMSLLQSKAGELYIEEVLLDEDISKISVVGVGMRSHAGIAAKTFETLAREGINILMISTSEIAISCVIRPKYSELAARSLHDAFNLGV